MSIDNKKNEFRQDIVSGDWILVAAKRLEYSKKIVEKKLAEKIKKSEKEIDEEIKNCPFEYPQKSGNGEPLLAFDGSGNRIDDLSALTDKWFLQIIPNKNPALEIHYNNCPVAEQNGPFQNLNAVGFHEVVITRDHKRTIANLTEQEIKTLLTAYKTRYIELSDKKCLKYILIFHNNGKDAGASVNHPHSQILATPIIPPDVGRSLNGCGIYAEKYKKCVHCETIEWELKQSERIIYQNSKFVAFCPYASHFNFEIRIFPLAHKKNFELIQENEIEALSDIFKQVFGKMRDKLQNPAYNFFIHTAPLNYLYDYHWHIEILPRISVWGGFELGTGIEVIVVPPEKAAEILTYNVK